MNILKSTSLNSKCKYFFTIELDALFQIDVHLIL